MIFKWSKKQRDVKSYTIRIKKVYDLSQNKLHLSVHMAKRIKTPKDTAEFSVSFVNEYQEGFTDAAKSKNLGPRAFSDLQYHSWISIWVCIWNLLNSGHWKVEPLNELTLKNSREWCTHRICMFHEYQQTANQKSYTKGMGQESNAASNQWLIQSNWNTPGWWYLLMIHRVN